MHSKITLTAEDSFSSRAARSAGVAFKRLIVDFAGSNYIIRKVQSDNGWEHSPGHPKPFGSGKGLSLSGNCVGAVRGVDTPDACRKP